MYKLVAIDMDGTLLKEDKTVSEKTKEAIKKAREKKCKSSFSNRKTSRWSKKIFRRIRFMS